MGQSIAVSLEETALAQFGPIDIVLRSQQPFDATIADRLPQAAGVAYVQGASSMSVIGSALHPRAGRAEPFASIRGVSAQEATTLGPLSGAPEPGPGQVVLSEKLATRLDARIGDRVTLRAPDPGASSVDTDVARLVGASNVPTSVGHTLEVRDNAIGIGAEIGWETPGPNVTITATAPSGIAFANASTSSPLRLVVEPPLETGTWTFRVTSDVPVVYAGGAAVAYLPASLASATVTLDAQVVGIAADEGRAAITGRPSALVPLADLQRAMGQHGHATIAYYHSEGDPRRAVAAMQAALPSENATQFDITAEKADRIDDAKETGAGLTGFLLVMGGFTLLAAALLAFTLFSALVEERRAELGIARALGLTRGEVALSMTIEGGLYAAASAIVGLALGLALLVAIFVGIRQFAPDDAPQFAVHVSPGTIALAFALGTLIPLATIGFASLRFARLDPARAIRGIPDDPKGKRNLALGFGGALLLAGAALSFAGVGWLVGIPIALVGLALALVAFKQRWLAAAPAVAALAHMVWSLYTFDSFPEERGELDPILTLARGAVMALGFAALAVASARPYLLLARRNGRAPFLAAKYLVARRRPVGLTMAMIALVVVVVTVMGTLFVVFGGTIPSEEAGYAIIGQSATSLDAFPHPLPPDIARDIERTDFLPRHTEFRQANVTRDGHEIPFEFGARQYLGATPAFADANEYELSDRAPDYASDRDAWHAVAAGNAILFPDFVLENTDLHPGDHITLETAIGGPRQYVVAGGVRSQFAFQTWLAADHVRAMGFPTSATAFVRVRDGADPNDVAHRLAALYDEDGVTFTSIPEEVATALASIRALVLVFEGFLALGLFVGLAATGFLASRAVHERMRDIGTLRALGYEERDVRRAFILESTLTSAGGLLIGTLVGVLVAHTIWYRALNDQDVPFRPPWLMLAAFAIAVLALAAYASRGPAKRAAALPPAIAVRYVE
ncbi:MAG TPA: FtsX-like permease family protein [Candidatus Thermoplasmatota archaeon]|nr:FtsX-like permease family protein [Candidatus Thermoplasmatota archaeon]